MKLNLCKNFGDFEMRNWNKLLITPLYLFALASLMMGLNSGIYDPSFNNYLAQVHHVSEVVRGVLEFPREVPGFLVVFLITALLFLADTRIAAISALLVGIALWGQAYLSPGLSPAVVWMVIWSIGAHIYMTISPSIGLRLAAKGQEGKLLGRLGSLEALGSLLGMATVFVGASYFHASFGVLFGISGTCALAASILLFRIKPQPFVRERRLILKKQYTLYYLLNILFGARKQIFLTFAPWLLIKIFHTGVSTFAILGLIGTILSLFFRPTLGIAVDRLGERKVIAGESIFLVIICLLYGFSVQWFSNHIAMVVIMACYIADQLLFSVRIARSTYLHRILDDPNDLTPTLSMGVTMDHAVSMLVPVGAGLLWANCGYQWVFVLAAFIALVNLAAAFCIPERNR